MHGLKWPINSARIVQGLPVALGGLALVVLGWCKVIAMEWEAKRMALLRKVS